MRINDPVTSSDLWTEGDLVVRYLGWTVRTVVRALTAADGHLGAETAMIQGALHRSVTRTGLVHPPRRGHVMGTFYPLGPGCSNVGLRFPSDKSLSGG